MYFLSQDQKAVGSGLVWLCRAQDIDEFESHSIYYALKCLRYQRSTLLYTWFIIVLVKQHMHTFRKKVLNVSLGRYLFIKY